MKTFVLFTALVLIMGCSKQAPAPVAAKPSETVVKFWDALSRSDTAAYMRVASQSRRESMTAHPDRWIKVLEFWKKNKASVQIVSESQDSSIALVTYRLTIAGDNPSDSTVSTQLYREDGGWKYGW
jgi:hypothetical protein